MLLMEDVKSEDDPMVDEHVPDFEPSDDECENLEIVCPFLDCLCISSGGTEIQVEFK